MNIGRRERAILVSLAGICLFALLSGLGFMYGESHPVHDKTSKRAFYEILMFQADSHGIRYDKPGDGSFNPFFSKTISSLSDAQIADVAILSRQYHEISAIFVEERLGRAYGICLEKLSNSSNRREALHQVERIKRSSIGNHSLRNSAAAALLSVEKRLRSGQI